MIVRIINNGIVADDKLVLDNLRMNFAGGGRIRLIANVCDGDKTSPIDVLIYRIDHGLHKLTKYAIQLDGIEKSSNKIFSLHLIYDISREKLSASLKTDGKVHNITINSAADITNILKAL